ncbi:MFS transporter [Ferruginibacter sp. HRS2-29]|uniref:MFS transporter n=1 Tax=Ferruginibacter sp. HRS2-29 TaxID=2487334 RepID=UPI0020CC738C|nr:MFS transporter [Ferruginibacter sp. HRS2-29]MCP9752273.1 MFS transporter [Ferruginibacter sp. HRS2-29]
MPSFTKQNPYLALRIPEFKHFIIGRFIFTMGIRMTTGVIAWWMYELTNNTLALGLVGLAEVIPAISLALYAGHYIDRNEKRKLLLTCMTIYLCCMGVLFFLSTDYTRSVLNHWVIAGIMCTIIAITGAVRAFSGPSMSAMISQIVPKEILPGAVSLSSSGYLISSIIGHATAGFLIAHLGVHNTFYVVLIFISTSIFFFSKLKVKPVFEMKESKTWQSVKEGLQYVFKTKELLGAMSLDMFAVLFGGAAALMPVFAKDILHVGPEGFSWLNAATDIGSICTVTFLSIWPLQRRQGKILLFAVGIFGLCMISFAVSTVFWISFMMLVLSGCMDGVSVIVRSTILQLKTPDELRGRVLSVSSMFINSSNELGQFESGVMARLLGTVPSVIFGGCMTVGVVVTTWFKAPSLRKMEY